MMSLIVRKIDRRRPSDDRLSPSFSLPKTCDCAVTQPAWRDFARTVVLFKH